MNRTWWKESVIYQIYPRSFHDTTGNGMGDIRGIINKLDYIKSLGVDIIWLCPVYESPNYDNGYDISNYKKISPRFGSEKDFDELLEQIHSRGLKLIMDLVVNHTSFHHHWFEESKKSKDNPYRNFYFWRKGKNGGPPNNWQSFFSGDAWTYDKTTDEYYLHLFTREQPDLNWENPAVREEVYKIMKFWLDKGVDGFRMDVISLISKLPKLPDTNTSNFDETIRRFYANGPKIHEYLKEMNQKVLSKYDIMTVGEGPGIDLENGPLYVEEERKELNMIFHFGHMFIDNGPGGKYDPVDVDLVTFKNVFNQWDEQLKNRGWGSIFLGNHDFSRMVSRFGNDTQYHRESAKLLATLLCTLRGTTYVYQGDEIGMTNVAFSSIEEYNDVETLNSWKAARARGENMDAFLKIVHRQSRDNARTPMQWNSEKEAGFTEGTPWLPLNQNYIDINVAKQEEDTNSILHYYRDIIAFRKQHPVLVYGDYESLDHKNPQIYAYRRWNDNHEFIIIHNFSDSNAQWNYIEDTHLYTMVKTNSKNTLSLFEFAPWQTKILKKN